MCTLEPDSAMRSLHIAAREKPLQQQRPSTAKNYFILKKKKRISTLERQIRLLNTSRNICKLYKFDKRRQSILSFTGSHSCAYWLVLNFESQQAKHILIFKICILNSLATITSKGVPIFWEVIDLKFFS